MAEHLVVQISDVHLTPAGELAPGVRPADNLIAALRLLADARIDPDLLLLTGDLANEGDGPSYDELTTIVGNYRSRSGATVVYLPGNHDHRPTFRKHLLGQSPDKGPVNQVAWHNGLRLVALDSTVPGKGYGLLDDETVLFLCAALSEPAPDGTLIAMHHPPIPSPIEPMSRARLSNPEALARVIAGSDARAILCGHNHHPGTGMLGAVPVWMSPATAYLADVTSTQEFRGVPGSAISRIDVLESTIVATVIPLSRT
jgi:3',5'-cyclic-AMP phosphodiesterase